MPLPGLTLILGPLQLRNKHRGGWTAAAGSVYGSEFELFFPV